jgi:transcriptional regulator with XRE-family HTH domain
MLIYLSNARSLLPLLSDRRRALNYSPEDLSARCGLPAETIELLERGQFLPSPSQAYQLALALDIDPVGLGSWAMTELLLHPEQLAEHIARTAA